MRRPLEQAWGHDLSHVRLHTDADAAPVTTAFGADGLTTGSHVYLRPGLSDSGDHGRRVLRHELAHVVQQTGPRPMGGAHSSTPSPGVAGRGLQWDGAREAEAERASQAGAVPRSFGGGGLQPMFGVKFMKDFFARLGSGKTLVALMAMLAAAENGAQAAMLAPTEILARQHFTNLSALLRDVPVRVALLTGREKGRARSEIVDALARGDLDGIVRRDGDPHIAALRLDAQGAAGLDRKNLFDGALDLGVRGEQRGRKAAAEKNETGG